MSFDESFEDEVKVTIIATGFEEQSKDTIIKKPQRDLLGRPTAGTNVRKESENFILRGLKSDSPSPSAPQEKETFQFNQPEEDLETPAFITKRLNNEG
jgi:cell division GTPase FtsZ